MKEENIQQSKSKVKGTEKDMKKDRQLIENLLSQMKQDVSKEENLKIQALSKQIKRKMLETNLSDRRALGGILGTAILGIIGLAVGLNVIGIIIGGVLGAFLGTYAGRRIKENAMKQKKLLHINLHVIRFAALVQHLVDYDVKSVLEEEIRRFLKLMFSESKILILLGAKLQKYERKQVIKLQKKMIKTLKKPKYLLRIKEMYWVVKEWIKMKSQDQGVWQELELEIARTAFSFLRPFGRLFFSQRRTLNSDQKLLIEKVQSLLLSVPIIELREKYPELSYQQEEAEEQFLQTIYKEVELYQLKAIMEDQIVQEILKDDEIKNKMNQKKKQESGELEKNCDGSEGNQINIANSDGQERNGNDEKNQINECIVVWNYGKDNSPIPKNQNLLIKSKSRLIDLIQIASQQKQIEEDEASPQKKQIDGIEKKEEELLNAINPLLITQPQYNFNQLCQLLIYEPCNVVHLIKEVKEKEEEEEIETFHHCNQHQLKKSFQNEGYIQQKHLENNQEDEDLAAQTFTSLDKRSQSQNYPEQVKENESISKQYSQKQQQQQQKIIPHIQIEKVLPNQGHQGDSEVMFESHIDITNYQTNMEEIGTKNVKKCPNHCLSSKKLGSLENLQKDQVCPKNFLGFINKSFVEQQEGDQIQDMKEIVEELKQDNQSLQNSSNINPVQKASPLPLSESFLRNKHPDVFLKMNSSGSLFKKSTPTITDNLSNSLCPQQGNFLSKNQCQKSKLQGSLREKQYTINEEDSQQNEQIIDKIATQKSNEENSGDINISLRKSQSTYQQEIQEKQQQQIPNEGSQEEKGNQSNLGSNYYSKDDQIQFDHIEIDVMKLSQKLKSSQQSKDDPEIEEKMNRLKELDHENPDKLWEQVIDKGNIKIYKKQIPNNPSVMVRAEASIDDCSQEEVFDQIYYAQWRKKWDKVTLGFSVIDDLGDMKDIIYFYIDPGFGVAKRDFLQKRAVRRDFPEKGDISILFFSITHPSMPEKKGWIRAISHIAAYVIRPLKGKQNGTRLSIITQSDVKGQIPKYIVNFLAARAPAKWIESMKKGVKDHRKLICQK